MDIYVLQCVSNSKSYNAPPEECHRQKAGVGKTIGDLARREMRATTMTMPGDGVGSMHDGGAGAGQREGEGEVLLRGASAKSIRGDAGAGNTTRHPPDECRAETLSLIRPSFLPLARVITF